MIDIDLEDFNCRLGNHKTETSSGPARLILIGKASAEMMGLKTTEKAYHIDVMLDLQATGERLVHIRQCMKQAGVFREFDRPEEDTKKAWKTFFGTSAHRAVVFNEVAGKGKCVSNKKHLKAYVMDTDRALEFELRRMADRGSNQRTRDISLNTAAALWAIRQRGDKLHNRSNCQDLKYIRADAGVPGDSITAVENLYKHPSKQSNQCDTESSTHINAKRKAVSLPGN